MTEGKPFDHLIFDLDDTLLDTYRQLVPRASREACTEMIRAGLKTDIDQALAAWEEHGKKYPRREIFSHLVSHFGVESSVDPQAVSKRGFFSFYNRKVEPDITLFKGAREMLARLQPHYGLHLVTSGTRVTQEEKIRILEIRDFFQDIFHVDPSQEQNKTGAFKTIISMTRARPDRHLSIGNRIDTDIGEARALGCKGCWVRYGEHANMHPSSPTEYPDFTIDNITELVDKCRL